MFDITTKRTRQVYVQTDETGRVLAIGSSAFLRDVTGWVLIDDGSGDRYLHAQGNYMPLPIHDERGVCRYRIEGGNVVERTQEEMDADALYSPSMPNTEDRLTALEQAGLERDSALMELASLLTALTGGM